MKTRVIKNICSAANPIITRIFEWSAWATVVVKRPALSRNVGISNRKPMLSWGILAYIC